MAKPLNRAQSLQNRQFLRELRRTGNIRLAARAVGLKYSTMQHRRAHHPAFAQSWDAALAFAQARFNTKGRQGPKAKEGGNRTAGGEPVVVRRNDGKLQMRAAQPGKLTRECEQAFLSALGATANVRLSAAAAGASVAAFYRRRRNNPAFAREMRLALEAGYERLNMALLASASPHSHDDDAWRHNTPPDMPPMTVNQALQLMYLHQKQVLMLDEPPHIKRRRGESREMHRFRLSAMYEASMQREREKFEVAEAARRERGEPSLWEATKIEVDLGQVTGWSKAKPHGGSGAADETANAGPAGGTADPSDDAGYSPVSGLAAGEDRALFGGWRIGDMRKKGG